MIQGKTDLADLSQHNVNIFVCLSVTNAYERTHLDPTWLVKKLIIPLELSLK